MNLIPWRNRSLSRAHDGPADALRAEMDRLFDSFFQDPATAFGGMSRIAPALDVSENDNEVVVRAELPGIQPEDIEITLQEGQLTISGEKKDECEKEGKGGRHYSECRYGAFYRSVQLPSTVNEANVEAQHRHGLLTIRLHKAESQKPRRIAVKNGNGARGEQGNGT